MKDTELDFIPLFLNITGKKILIIGGGKVALHKLSSISLFTKDITILSLEFLNEIEETEFKKIKKSYEKKDLNDYNLVYACTNNRAVNQKIKEDANNLGLLVNVADDPLLCDFISPAVFRKGFITVAVSSNAKDVKRAVTVRNKIKNILEND